MEKALELSKKYHALLKKNKVDTPLRLAHFFAQIEHESGLKAVSENLNYSMNGLRKTFGKYFKTMAEASYFAGNPEKIANKVYANRMGNGDERSGDGWKYRGRGFIQITGKSLYEKLSKEVKVDYVNEPDLLLTEADAMISALWYWTNIKGNELADKNQLDSISDLINIGRKTLTIGDANGYEHRKKTLEKMVKLFK